MHDVLQGPAHKGAEETSRQMVSPRRFWKGLRNLRGSSGSLHAFYCEWMRNPSLGPEWKPDKAKLVVSFPDIWVDPSVPNAWREPPYFTRIKQWAVEGPERGEFVLVRIGPRLIVVLPDREVDLGHVDPEAQLTVRRERGPTGVRYDVEVIPR